MDQHDAVLQPVEAPLAVWPAPGCTQLIRYSTPLLRDILQDMMSGFANYPWGGVESGGVLFGTRSPAGIAILQYRQLTCEHAHGPSFELSPADRHELLQILDSPPQNLEPLGFYLSVSHRELALNDSGQQLFAEFFPHPWQIALVIKRSRTDPPQGALYFREIGDPAQLAAVHGPLSMDQPEAEAAQPPAPSPAAASAPPGVPFSLTFDPAFFYPSPSHRDALTRLTASIEAHKGFCVLTGDSGSGKTFLLECLTDQLCKRNIQYAFLFHSRLDPAQFFELLALDFDLKIPNPSKTAVLIALNEHLIRRAQDGQTTVLLIDDAHKLPIAVLEEIELLGNLETRKGKLLQVVFAALPEFEDVLDTPALQSLKQRILIRSRLLPLTLAESAAFIDFRLEQAAPGAPSLLATGLLPEFHRLTRGLPRLITAAGALLRERSPLQPAGPELLAQVSRELALDHDRHS